MITQNDIKILRETAKQYIEFAVSDENQNKVKLWRELHETGDSPPLIRIETSSFLDRWLPPLVCESEMGRYVERYLTEGIAKHTLVKDDEPIKPFIPSYITAWYQLFGLDIKVDRVKDADGGDYAQKWRNIMESPSETDVLGITRMGVDREWTKRNFDMLNETFGDIIPVRPWGPHPDYSIAAHAFYLMGLENMLAGFITEPDESRALFEKIAVDITEWHRFIERENLLTPEAEVAFTPYGKDGDKLLPCPKDPQKLIDTWAFMSCQEFACVSPDMYGEFIFPIYQKAAEMFGRIMYACCEPVHLIWEPYLSKIPNIGAVSVTPWCDEFIMGEYLRGGPVIYTRKPHPSWLSGESFDEEGFANHINTTLEAAKGCRLQFIYRDVINVRQKDCPGRAVEIMRDCIDKTYK